MSPTIVKRTMWKAARLLGGRWSRWSWNNQFTSGRWSFLETERSRFISQICASICDGGSIIDCGCGEGWLLDSLVDQEPLIGAYFGFDISRVAILKAVSRCRDMLMPHSFIVSDMASWQHASNQAALILAEESIYYLSAAERTRFVEHVLASLAPEGVALLVVHDCTKFTALLDDIEQSAPAAMRVSLGTRAAVLIGENLNAVQRAARIISIHSAGNRSIRKAA